MKYIILDLEATCWEGCSEGQNETIEIGALMIDEQGKTLSEFVQFIKPLKHPVLSNFCKGLTSIKQKDVDEAPYFNEAIQNFKSWIGVDEGNYLLCSWGFYDRKQFESDCKLHGLDYSWVEPHISLKHQYREILNLRRAIGMKRALINEGMELDGTHHRGIDDARNIAKIFVKYMGDWKMKMFNE